jgi:SAM-dependent methyltransferase
MLSKFFKLFSISDLKHFLNNQNERDEFVLAELQGLEHGNVILDAGCGSQRYKVNCQNLDYRSQDFGQYTVDEKKTLGNDGMGGKSGYEYGPLDYMGDIWAISEKDSYFDAILCTEVFEHIPYPIETIKEFARILKPNGKLILTAPSNCLRHMDPYFYYSGFSDRWFDRILKEQGFEVVKLIPVGDYYKWMAIEIARTMKANSRLAIIPLMTAFFYFYFKKQTDVSVDALCSGYHVVARKID